jgi:AcrR family transcriptional regulator
MARPPANHSETTTKEKIFLVAVDLFAQEGYHGVSIRDITREVGIKESSFYNHYQSKDVLLEEILNYFKAEIAKMKIPDPLNDETVLKKVDPVLFFQRSVSIFMQYADTPLMAKIYRIAVIEQFHDIRSRDIIMGLYEAPLPILTHYLELVLAGRRTDSYYNPQVLANNYQFALHALIAELSLRKHYQLDTRMIDQRITELNHFFGEFVKKIMRGDNI